MNIEKIHENDVVTIVDETRNIKVETRVQKAVGNKVTLKSIQQDR